MADRGGNRVSNFSTDHRDLPYDYQVVMAALGSSDPLLRPRICPYCEKSFRNSQALGGHLSTHRTRTKEASQREEVKKPPSQSPEVTLSPQDQDQMIKKRGFNWFGECYVGGNTVQKIIHASNIGPQKVGRSPELVDYKGVLEHGEGTKSPFDNPASTPKLMSLAKFVQEEKATSLDGKMASSSDGIDLTLKL